MGPLTVLRAGADDLFHAHCTPVQVILVGLGGQEGGEGEGGPGGGGGEQKEGDGSPLARAHGQQRASSSVLKTSKELALGLQRAFSLSTRTQACDGAASHGQREMQVLWLTNSSQTD